MSADRFAEVERLYHEARTRRPEERAEFLNQSCGGDEALRHEVESLLALRTDADGFLSRSALEEAARTNHRAWDPDSWPTIPGYTVRRVLGEGGMGVVYLAEQETPLRRLVALKLIKPGMDTRQVVARFETERQALALMDHPNIAAVFDAGSTEDGRPYFVMEFVDGVAITDYCDRGRLSTRDRLALFVQVCAAVQHAHQKGVIHRDLKPSNVLVTERDGHALPKVIDFGTAKAVAGAWNATATQGGQGMVLGTLEYMSPEQAALSADIDTATDVYSLGVLLYELLVGRLPFDTDELRAAGYDEIRRVIRESDPPKPSVRVEQRRDSSGPAARARQTDAPGLTRQLRGDLDWITLKALEKDRKRRYATAAAFATDIERFLGDQPVDARPPSSTYRIRKFTRRHRLAVAAVAIILTILGAGVTATTGLYWQAEQSRREAMYLAYTATLAAAAGDLRTGAAPEARGRLLTVPKTQRGWEWQHLFVQADESVFSLASATSSCEPTNPGWLFTTKPALSFDADGEALLLQKCVTVERWSTPSFTHTEWAAPARTVKILAVNARGQMLTLPDEDRRPWHLVLTDRTGASTVVALGPFHLPVCADISPDGARIAVGIFGSGAGDTTPDPDDVFEVWNAATGQFQFRLVAPPPSLRDTRARSSCVIQFSPDGRRIATSGASVHVWDAATGVERAADSLQAGEYGQAIAFSRDSNRLAIGRPNGLVDVLDLGRSGATLRRLAGTGLVMEESIPDADRIAQTYLRRKREVLTVAFSPDGQTVVSGTSTNIGVWDVGQSKLVRFLAGHTADVMSLVVSADGRRIYSVDAIGAVRAWTLSSAPAVVRTPGSFANVSPFSASADGSVIATTTSDGALTTVRLADLHEEVIRAGTGPTVTLPSSIPSMAISPDGLRIFTGGFDEIGSIHRWTAGSWETVAVSSEPVTNCKDVFSKTSVSGLTLSPGGRLLAFVQGFCVAVWDASTMKQVAVFVDVARPTGLLFRDDDTLIISTLDARSDAISSGSPRTPGRDSELPRTLDGFWTRGRIPDRGRGTPELLNQSLNPVIRIWNWRTNRVFATRVLATVESRLAVGLQNVRRRLTLRPDGRRIALISDNFGKPSTVSIWDGNLNAEVGRLPPGDYLALAFSPDGRRIVSVGAEESVVRVWDAERLLPLLTLPDTDSHLGGVGFTAAGQIVAGRTGGGLTIWDSQIRRQ